MLAKWRRLTRVRLLSARRAMRDMEAGIILFGALIGAVVSVCIVGLHLIVELAHIAIFSLSEHELLSAQLALPTWRLALVPAGIGLVLGVTAYVLNRIRPAATGGCKRSMRRFLSACGVTGIAEIPTP